MKSNSAVIKALGAFIIRLLRIVTFTIVPTFGLITIWGTIEYHYTGGVQPHRGNLIVFGFIALFFLYKAIGWSKVIKED
jgi:hypothetical protein